MKISLEWLQDYIELPKTLSLSQLMHDLTMATVEVEGAETFGPDLEHIVVAKVASLEEVPEKKNLKLTRCETGTKTFQVLCGADNVKAGMKVALALPGATIRPYGEQEAKTVSTVTVSGRESQAVICAASEIGLEALFPTENKRAIIDLTDTNLPLGAELKKALAWEDSVLEIDNKSLTNRPDLWGHYGIARELAAIYKLELKPATRSNVLPATKSFGSPLIGELDPRYCNRFTAVAIENCQVQVAPLWMRSRLARLGQKSINLYADATNYIMFAVGQPCHAYDLDQISLPLSVRVGKPNEKVTLLDGLDYTLITQDSEGEGSAVLAISDAKGAVAAAGIMGGASSGISPTTTRVYLETANFDPVFVRRGAKRLGLRTDASSRFEKGIDTQRIDQSLLLFFDLIASIDPNAKIVGFEDRRNQDTGSTPIQVDKDFLLARLGKEISTEEIVQLLTSVGFQCDTIQRSDQSSGKIAFSVLPPSWRSTGDVSERFDLIEEVARLHGYDDFQFSPPTVTLPGRTKNSKLALERRVREILSTNCGMREIVTYPWVKSRFLEAGGFSPENTLHLACPPAPDQASLQPSLVPNLLESLSLNLRYFPEFRIFEVGGVFPKSQSSAAKSNTIDPRETLPYQEKRVAGVLVGTDHEILFRQAKGFLEKAARAAHITALDFSAAAPKQIELETPWADTSGVLYVKHMGETERHVGTLGVLSNRAKRLSGIRRAAVVVFELNLDQLEPLPSRENTFRPLPEFPVVDYDLSLVFDNQTKWSSIVEAVHTAHPLIQEVLFVDQYRGSDIPQGKKSLTLRLRLASPERTLKSDEAQEVSSLVTAVLGKTYNAQFREALVQGGPSRET